MRDDRFLHSQLAKTSLADEIVKWTPYNSDTSVVDKFTLEQWHMILESLSTEIEFRSFLQELKDVTACFLLEDIHRNDLIAFCLVCLIDSGRKIVEFHGGGWANDLLSPCKYFRGVRIMMRALHHLGFKVRTQCKTKNIRALRFIKAAGFKSYRHDNEFYYFYLPRGESHNGKVK